ncbi:TetR family transcriptional regulator C-terminal domain-containing protein [Paraburkholderia sediminicola]|uniref:TetR/AcrR family transcriptional regulator n=1 Tax=Paraburkholderia sediminicola TaxID=458836 RepID=UPI0038BB8B8E
MEQAAARRGPKPNPETRKKLLEAGVQMLHAGGYAATGIQEIVGVAEVPKGSFYNHFESKEAFGAEVVDAYFGPRAVRMQAIFGDTSMAPLQRLALYFDRRIAACVNAGYARGCLIGNLSLEVADHSESIRAHLSGKFTVWTAALEDCIRQAQQDGSIKNPMPASLLAQFVLNSWEGALLRMRAEKGPGSLEVFRQVVFQSILV